ncbi:hypothetical protein Tco_0974113 [Tanacetum coccineum]|uniref:O-fucosyltransferase family protein n=1 Tax=Tanacetum coccineum TaxID=301880 RepID=A0ABQ5EAN2_9ASTR
MPLFPSPEPSVSCIDDLDFFKDFENEFPAIVYNDALTSKSDFSTEPTLCPQRIDEFDLKDETSLFEYDKVEQNVLYLNDLLSFNIIYPDDQKSNKDNDDNEIDMIQSLGGNENTQGSNKLLEASHDKINKVLIMKSFVMELNVNIVTWNYLVNGMLFNLIKNLYVSFGIPFNPKWYYKDGDCTRMLRRPMYVFFTLLNLGKIGIQEQIRRIRLTPIRHVAPLPPRDQNHLWLRYQVVGYTEEIVHNFKQRLETIFRRHVNRVYIIDFEGLTPDMRQDLAERLRLVYTRDDGQELGRARRSMTWRQFILALGLHIAKEMAEDGFGAYLLRSKRVIPDKGDLSDYWVEISSGGDFLRGAPSYTYIRDPVRRLCHSIDQGVANVPYLLAEYLFRHVEGRKSGARLSGGHFIGRLAHHFGLVSDDGLRGLSVVTHEIPLIDMGELVKLNICKEIEDDWAWVAPGPERQQVVADGAPEAAEDSPTIDEGA